MYEEEIHFGKVLLKQSEMVLEHFTLVTFDPMTPKSIGFLLPRMDVWTKFEESSLGQDVLGLLILNSFDTFDPGDLDL